MDGDGVGQGVEQLGDDTGHHQTHWLDRRPLSDEDTLQPAGQPPGPPAERSVRRLVRGCVICGGGRGRR